MAEKIKIINAIQERELIKQNKGLIQRIIASSFIANR